MTDIKFELLQYYDAQSKRNKLPKQIKDIIKDNLNPKFSIRDYQKEAFIRLEEYIEHDSEKQQPIHLLLQMATGSGKTLIMAGSILYLYQLGYRNFIFFVNSTNVLEKTRDNFLNTSSMKYLFRQSVSVDNKQVSICECDNFEAVFDDDISICFTTIQGLHTRLNCPSENSLTYEDFENKKTVLLSDEAHHLNVATKSKQQSLLDEENNWEATVMKVLNANPDNVMLEFTATAELTHSSVANKYVNKFIYDYSLRKFYLDRYSKDVQILQSTLPVFERALLACVLSQYRLHIFADYKINIKPVIMFKANQANRTAKTDDTKAIISSEFKDIFLNKIANMQGQELIKLSSNAKHGVLAKAFAYFINKDAALDNLALQLREAFEHKKCILVDSSTTVDKKENQLLLNSLENPDNPIRAVFAVDALNEGWDVLNLFDIVRLYNTRDVSANKPGGATVREAQLIGRGARYCPFKIDEDSESDRRKFDKDLEHQLRVCEELYYHSEQNSRYIQELNTALEDIGIPTSDNKVTRELKLKNNFKNHDFYKYYSIFTNKREHVNNSPQSGIDESIRHRTYQVILPSSLINQANLLHNFDLTKQNLSNTLVTKTITIKAIDSQIVRKAIAKNQFYRFNHLKNECLPHLTGIDEFISADNYLANIFIDVKSYEDFDISNLNPELKLFIVSDFLGQLQKQLSVVNYSFIGSKEFMPKAVNSIFKETKQLSFILSKDGDAEFGYSMREPKKSEFFLDLSNEDYDWYAYNENYGTSEEKSLVMFMKDEAMPHLRKKYQQIWLLRNEKFFQLYNFADGQAFEPDFVLFLVSKNGIKEIIYQVFIEPKGSHLLAQDKWKDEFLQSIKDNYKVADIFNNKDYALLGLPFYNSGSKAKFKDILYQSV
jgi:type III restriction enzyme